MTEPAEEDVKRLAGILRGADTLAHCYEDQAIGALAAGVTLPPEPDTPPEPQERFYTEYGSNHFWVVDRSGETDSIRTGHNETAELVASLLNLDATYEDQGGVGKALEQAEVRSRMRYGAMSHMEAERDEARAERDEAWAELDEARAKVTREREDRDLERDLFAAKVERLKDKALPDRMHLDAVIAERDEALAQVEHLTDELAKRPTEPLFTALMVDHDGTNVTLAAEDSTSTYPRKGAQLAVYDRWDHRPLGAAPTDRPVTAEDVAVAIETAAIAPGGTWSIPVGGLNGLADAINAQLGRTPAPQQDRSVTAEMVIEAIEAAGVRDGLDRGDGPAYIRPCDWTSGEAAAVTDALNVQLGRTPMMTGEALARHFHETYERLAPEFGYRTREESAKPWEQVPERNRLLMVAVCDEILSQLYGQQAGEGENDG